VSRFFDRSVRLVVGKPGEPPREFGAVDGTTGAQLRVAFDIKKSKSRTPNQCSITIYNLTRDSAAYVCQDKNHVLLYAGYGDDLSLLFSGEIKRSSYESGIKGPDRITKFKAAAGGQGYRSARINKSYASSVKMSEIITELAKSFGVKADLSKIDDATLSSGFVASGRSADVMNQLARSLRFDWFFDDDNKLIISSKDKAASEQVVSISPKSGLVGYLEIGKKGTINGTSLLNNQIRVKFPIRVDGVENGVGTYIVQKVGHKGDTGYSKNFYTTFEAKVIVPGEIPGGA
jgi:hypothetical protein